MKAIYKIMFIMGLVAFSLTSLSAQQIQGIAIYKTSARPKINFDSTRMSPETMAQLKQQLQKQMQNEFELIFDNTSSVWKQVESLDSGPATASVGGLTLSIRSRGANDIWFKDIQEGVVEQGTELMGKLFLIKDELPQYAWQLRDETKQIGQYTCHKAVYEKIMETSKDTVTVEAWYTPEIPVSHGPEHYWGLPGLIMEIKSGNRIMICSKIILNPNEEIQIVRPKGGKMVNREEFQAIEEKKRTEMENKYQKSSGDNTRIRIGG